MKENIMLTLRIICSAFSLVLAVSTYTYATDDTADRVFLSGKIYTVNPAQPWASAMAIEDGEIVFIGDNEGATGFIGGSTEVINLNGKMVLPGIHDIHMHPLEAGNPAAGTCQFEGGENPEDLIDYIAECAEEQVGTDWITGWGHSIFDLLETDRAPADILEDAIPGRPAVFMEATSHSQWVNRTALRLAGITADTPDPAGGHIVKDPATGEPNGILFDNAGDLVVEIAYKPTPELLDLAYDGLLENLSKLSALGITSVADARVYWTRRHHEVWLRAEAEDALTVRANLGLWAYPHMDDSQLDVIKSLYSYDPERLLQVNQIKYYSDGLIVNSTAALKKPYNENYQLTPHPTGMNYFDEKRLTKFITELEKIGFDANIHTLGDRAIHDPLNAIEATARTNGPNIDRRHRLTHVEMHSKADIERFKKIGVIADMQVAGDWTFPENYEDAQSPYIGKRAKHAVPLKSIYDTGATVTLSSDFDVSTPNPFAGMQHALTRGKESLPSLESVIEAYTINPAYVLRQEERVGTLEAGKRADLIVIDRNLFEIDIEEISHTKVLMTLMDGSEVFRAVNF